MIIATLLYRLESGTFDVEGCSTCLYFVFKDIYSALVTSRCSASRGIATMFVLKRWLFLAVLLHNMHQMVRKPINSGGCNFIIAQLPIFSSPRGYRLHYRSTHSSHYPLIANHDAHCAESQAHVCIVAIITNHYGVLDLDSLLILDLHMNYGCPDWLFRYARMVFSCNWRSRLSTLYRSRNQMLTIDPAVIRISHALLVTSRWRYRGICGRLRYKREFLLS